MVIFGFKICGIKKTDMQFICLSLLLCVYDEQAIYGLFSSFNLSERGTGHTQV